MNESLSLKQVLATIESFKGSLPPVHSWAPERDAEMDLEITREGQWIHEGGVIERQPLVKLLASVLRREDDGRYALVTPQERVFIRVQDAPFQIVDWELIGQGQSQCLTVESNLGEYVVVDREHTLWLKEGESSPYIMVRPQLAGRMTRAAYYRLAETLEERDGQWGLQSSGFFNCLSSESNKS